MRAGEVESNEKVREVSSKTFKVPTTIKLTEIWQYIVFCCVFFFKKTKKTKRTHAHTKGCADPDPRRIRPLRTPAVKWRSLVSEQKRTCWIPPTMLLTADASLKSYLQGLSCVRGGASLPSPCPRGPNVLGGSSRPCVSPGRGVNSPRFWHSPSPRSVFPALRSRPRRVLLAG